MSDPIDDWLNKVAPNLCDGLARQPVPEVQKPPATTYFQISGSSNKGQADETDQRSRTGSHSAAPLTEAESSVALVELRRTLAKYIREARWYRALFKRRWNHTQVAVERGRIRALVELAQDIAAKPRKATPATPDPARVSVVESSPKLPSGAGSADRGPTQDRTNDAHES